MVSPPLFSIKNWSWLLLNSWYWFELLQPLLNCNVLWLSFHSSSLYPYPLMFFFGVIIMFVVLNVQVLSLEVDFLVYLFWESPESVCFFLYYSTSSIYLELWLTLSKFIWSSLKMVLKVSFLDSIPFYY